MYYGFSDIYFWIYFIAFLPVVFVSFYIPGSILLSFLKIRAGTPQFVLSHIVGIALWGFQGYIFGYLNLRFATYLYCLAALLYFALHYKTYLNEFQNLKKNFKKEIIFPSILISVGVICQMLPIFGSGMKYSNGIKLFGNNSVDGVMHLSYIRSIVDYFPPREPGYSGLLIHNYHYWTDLVEADISRIWSLPIIHLFFQFFPVYLSILIGVVAFLLVIEWGGSRKMALWFLFFLYFASDAAYLVLLILRKPFGFYTPAIDSGVTQFLNMPHMFGKLIFLAALVTTHKYFKTKSQSWGILSVILCSSLFGFKIYFGLFVAIGFACVFAGKFFLDLFRKKRVTLDMGFLFFLFSFFILSIVIFLPHNYGAGGLVFVYLEWPRSLLGNGSIDWREWWLRRQVYEAAHNIRNLAILDSLAIVIAMVSIYGTRLIGFIFTKRLFKFLGYENFLFLIPGLIVFHLLGLFTIQSSGGVNVYNFFSVSAVVLALFSAHLLSCLKRNLIGILLVVFVVLLTVPRSLYEISASIIKEHNSDYYLVSNNELYSLSYLRNHAEPGSVVQASPYNPLDSESPYISFFTNHNSYIAGWHLLETHNVNTQSRREELSKIFASTNVIDFSSGLKKLGISYVYLQKTPEQMLKFKIDPTYMKIAYENSSTLVLKVQ